MRRELAHRGRVHPHVGGPLLVASLGDHRRQHDAGQDPVTIARQPRALGSVDGRDGPVFNGTVGCHCRLGHRYSRS